MSKDTKKNSIGLSSALVESGQKINVLSSIGTLPKINSNLISEIIASQNKDLRKIIETISVPPNIGTLPKISPNLFSQSLAIQNKDLFKSIQTIHSFNQVFTSQIVELNRLSQAVYEAANPSAQLYESILKLQNSLRRDYRQELEILDNNEDKFIQVLEANEVEEVSSSPIPNSSANPFLFTYSVERSEGVVNGKKFYFNNPHYSRFFGELYTKRKIKRSEAFELLGIKSTGAFGVMALNNCLSTIRRTTKLEGRIVCRAGDIFLNLQ